MPTLVWVVLVLLLIGALPTWHNYGYYPSGGLGIIVLIVILVVLLR